MFLSNFESNLQLDDGLNNAQSESEPAILFSYRPVSELDAAAVKLQKVYKSFRIRRNLADCAAAIEELWWKALDAVARKPISEHDAAVMIQKSYLSYRADHNSFKSTQSDGAETINVNDLNGNAPILTVCSEKKNSDWYLEMEAESVVWETVAVTDRPEQFPPVLSQRCGKAQFLFQGADQFLLQGPDQRSTSRPGLVPGPAESKTPKTPNCYS